MSDPLHPKPLFARRLLGHALAAAALAVSAPAQACSVATTTLAFGAIDPLQGVPTDSTTTISVECPALTSYAIAISPGSGTYSGRKMSSSDAQLAYQLYVDASRLTVWGDGSAGTAVVNGSADDLGSNHTVYGRVPHQPLARPGVYTDVLLVTVTF